MANDMQLNLGALRSTMQLTLHTHHASRIWHGRSASEGRATIIGLNGFMSVMNKMKRGAEQDDPYSDAWMLRIEDKLNDTKESLRVLREQVDQILSEVPSALSLGENLNVQPVKLPLFVNAQLGFMAVYLLADYDDLARRLILAHHTALIDRSTLEQCLNQGAHALRSLFSLAQQYKHSGADREDFAANNVTAQVAKERFGEIPKDVLEGSRRSRFAPPMIRRMTINEQQSKNNAAADESGSDSAEAPEADDSSAGYSPSEEEEPR